jgi:hypothetical protein
VCFPAGPPATIPLYTLAPELLIGWLCPNRAEECEYMLYPLAPDLSIVPAACQGDESIIHFQFESLVGRLFASN